MDQQHEPRSLAEKALAGLGIIAIISRVLAVSVEAILHTRMGRQALGLRALCATLVIPFWGILWPGEDLRPLLWFWFAFLAGCVVNRVFSAPVTEHTQYSGIPWIIRVFKRLDECKVKGVLEPVLVLGAGILLLPTSQALGSYLIVASVGLATAVGLAEAVLRAKVGQLNDARLEQERLAFEFRRLRRE